MPNRAGQRKLDAFNEPDHVIERAAELFDVLSAPQHLNTLYKAGILGKRRDAVRIYYRIIDGRVTGLCQSVCTQVTVRCSLA